MGETGASSIVSIEFLIIIFMIMIMIIIAHPLWSPLSRRDDCRAN